MQPALADFLRLYIAYIALVVLILIFGHMPRSRFLTTTNLSVVLQNSAVLSLVAIGITFHIIVGSINLSVGSC